MCCGDGKALYLSLSGKCTETSKASQHTEGQTRAGPARIKLQIIPTHCAEQRRVTEIRRDRPCTASKDGKKTHIITIL